MTDSLLQTLLLHSCTVFSAVDFQSSQSRTLLLKHSSILFEQSENLKDVRRLIFDNFLGNYSVPFLLLSVITD